MRRVKRGWMPESFAAAFLLAGPRRAWQAFSMHAPAVTPSRRRPAPRPLGLVIRLPVRRDQTAFNLRRWAEVLADPFLARVPWRVETDRFGNTYMSPPPSSSHGGFQSRIIYLLQVHMRAGRVMSECPMSTADGVKAADAVWISGKRWRLFEEKPCLPGAPEICVEVLSPSNSRREIEEKRALYFDAGAEEVWICDKDGGMTFYVGPEETARRSGLCPKFPVRAKLPKP